MQSFLVTGGAGYVGSAVAAHLRDLGQEVWIVDDLSRGRPELIAAGAHFVRARVGDREQIRELLRSVRFDCVMHFAAFALVGESMTDPERYLENNVRQTKTLLDELLAAGIRDFIFSSSCAVFGEPASPDHNLSEESPFAPINPYGRSKLDVEMDLRHRAEIHGLRAVALRYFNACGADPLLRVGEWHDPETHLIPLALRASRSKSEFPVFGAEYPTPDGTAVRDYLHVADLAQCHVAAHRWMASRKAGPDVGFFEAFNLGTGRGYSVTEVCRAVREVTGRELRVQVSGRRTGDPARLVAENAKARRDLGLKADGSKEYLKLIIQTADAWEEKKSQMKAAVFLDRDGTINKDPGYLSDPDQLELLHGAGEAIARLNRAGYFVVVVTNQSGVARGLIRPEALPKIHDRMNELLKPFGARIDHYAVCTHMPDAGCPCRKPGIGMFVESAQKLGIDLSRSFMVGDRKSDIDAGKNAFCKGGTVLVMTGAGSVAAHEQETRPDHTAPDLDRGVDWILSRSSPVTSPGNA